MKTVIDYVLYFFFYSALGWLVESIYCSVGEKKWINRGFLTGPICPIYGTGAVVLSVCLTPFKDKWYLVFIIGLILADIVEFITSVIMEKLFHARWWDYSDRFLNIQGRICFRHSIYWGIASLAFTYLVHPFFLNNIFVHLPDKYKTPLLTVILVIFAFDLINAVRAAMDIRKFMMKLTGLYDNIASTIGEIRNNVEQRLENVQNKITKQGMKLATWTAEVNQQLSDTRKKFDKMQKEPENKDAGREEKKIYRILTRSSALRDSASRRMDYIQEILDDIIARIKDEDDEMY